jgi:hypothetical protein
MQTLALTACSILAIALVATIGVIAEAERLRIWTRTNGPTRSAPLLTPSRRSPR